MIASPLLFAAVLAATPATAQAVAAAPSAQTASETAANRVVMERFVDLLLRRKQVAEAFQSFVAPDMIQHNARLGQGRAGAVAALAPMFADPGAAFEVDSILVDGDRAAVYYRGRLKAGEPGAVVAEFFRLRDGLIVEHWDVFQMQTGQ